MVAGESEAADLFRDFSQSLDFQEIRRLFTQICDKLQLNTKDYANLYGNLKTRLQTTDAKNLWRTLDRRAQHAEYQGKPCQGKKVLVIGAGPCGLRMAIEAALLGARVIVVELRGYISRNNVMHLWPYVIHDMRNIGAKVFFPMFGVGALDHISIGRMQTILLKVALLLGVQIHAPVKFESIVPPATQGVGWRCKFSSEKREEVEPLENMEFDVIIGADGKRNSLQEFKRQTFRGKLAIAITANFVNHRTKEDNAVNEIGGLFYVYSPEFFDNLQALAGIELENFVYFKDDTHYFVMTAKKCSLLSKGVLKKDCQDVKSLLSRDNIDRERLKHYARESAEISTNHQLTRLDFAQTHNGEDDVAIFDFTNMHHANNSCLARERYGRRLLTCLVGDTLNEPFWPTGTGCARGFLSVFDAAWLMRNWFRGERSPLELIAERESVYQLLTQTTPENLSSKYSKYTIDPQTRYGPKLRPRSLRPEQFKHLYVVSEESLKRQGSEKRPESPKPMTLPPAKTGSKRKHDLTLNSRQLLAWYAERLTRYDDIINIRDMTSSWSDGIALCAIVHLHNPELIDMKNVSPATMEDNVSKAFYLIEKEFGVSPTVSVKEMTRAQGPDRLAMLSYLTQLQEALENPQLTKLPRLVDPTEQHSRASERRPNNIMGMLTKVCNTLKRKTTAARKEPKEAPKPDDTQWVSGTLKRCQQRGIASERIKAFEKSFNSEKSQPADVIYDRTLASNESDTCCVCKKSIFIVERQSAHGMFFHSNCFRCATCRTALWPGNSVVAKDDHNKVLCYCSRHAPESGSMEEDDVFEGEAESKSGQRPEPQSPTKKLKAVTQMMSSIMGMMKSQRTPTRTKRNSSLKENGDTDETDSSGPGFVLSSQSDEEEEDNLITGMTNMTIGSDAIPSMGTLRLSTLAKSIRLLKGYEIQRDLADVEDQEHKLEKKGLEYEKTLRRKRTVSTGGGQEVEDLMDEWMEVIREKQELKMRQSKLLLQAKLLELQERQRFLLTQLNTLGNDAGDLKGMTKDVDMMESELMHLQSDMADTFTLLKDIREFLKGIGESEA